MDITKDTAIHTEKIIMVSILTEDTDTQIKIMAIIIHKVKAQVIKDKVKIKYKNDSISTSALDFEA